MTVEPVIGIDLGTTTCCLAMVDDGTPIVIPNRGYLTTPSVVAITASGQRVVGHAAKRQAVTNAEHTIIAMKRLIGRKWGSPEVETTQSTSSAVLVEGPNGDVRVTLRDQDYAIPQLNAMLLQELKHAAEVHLGAEVTKAVITVPAYFNDNQRQATRDAGEIAGIEVLRIINEPTAAALAYGFGKSVEKTIVVYDLGGGTFDISIVHVKPNGDFEVLGTGGDTFLGGEDFDRVVLEWLLKSFEKEHGIDLRKDRIAIQRLRDASESAKCALSGADVTEIHLPFLATPPGADPVHLSRTLNRRQFEDLSRQLVERTIEHCGDALRAANLLKTDVDDVLMVGGSSRIPAVHEAVTRYFGKKPCQGVHPDEAVAVGAAIHASSLAGHTTRVRLFDVTPHALGIKVAGNKFEALIPQNTRVPTSATLNVTTSRDDQVQIRVIVLQGFSEDADENELLGEFLLTGLRPAPAHELELDVAFTIDDDGIVSVTARDRETGLEQSIQVSASSGLTDVEIEEMSEEMSDFMIEALAQEEIRDAQQALEKVMSDTQRTCASIEKALTAGDVRREALSKAQAGLGKAKMALAGAELKAMRKAFEELTLRHTTLKGIKV